MTLDSDEHTNKAENSWSVKFFEAMFYKVDAAIFISWFFDDVGHSHYTPSSKRCMFTIQPYISLDLRLTDQRFGGLASATLLVANW